MAFMTADWDDRIGRRLSLRDLHILSTVVQQGSMAKAARDLGMSQPSISEAMAKLEAALRVRLLDRSPRGIEPTIYAQALLKRGLVVFDELRQGISDIESLANPASGEVRVGCPESLAGVISTIIERLSLQYPQVIVHVVPIEPAMMQLDILRERSVDLVMGRLSKSLVGEDIEVETLFEDRLLVVAGARNRWARHRKVTLADLVNEKWILIPQSNFLSLLVTEAFRAQGLDVPRESVTTVSLHVRSHLLATGRFLAIMPGSALKMNAERWGLKELPIDLGAQPPPNGILTLKHRTLSPAVQLFIAHTRAVAKSMRLTARPAKRADANGSQR